MAWHSPTSQTQEPACVKTIVTCPDEVVVLYVYLLTCVKCTPFSKSFMTSCQLFTWERMINKCHKIKDQEPCRHCCLVAMAFVAWQKPAFMRKWELSCLLFEHQQSSACYHCCLYLSPWKRERKESHTNKLGTKINQFIAPLYSWAENPDENPE